MIIEDIDLAESIVQPKKPVHVEPKHGNYSRAQ